MALIRVRTAVLEKLPVLGVPPGARAALDNRKHRKSDKLWKTCDQQRVLISRLKIQTFSCVI